MTNLRTALALTSLALPALACSPAPATCDPALADCATSQAGMTFVATSMSGAGPNTTTNGAGASATGTSPQGGANGGGPLAPMAGASTNGGTGGVPSSGGAGATAGGAGAGGMLAAAGSAAAGMASVAGMGGMGTAGNSAAGASTGGEPNVGGAGSGEFAPCPASEPCKILPLGDSITDGFGVPGGYRIELFRMALGAGKDITFTGNEENGPTMVDGQSFPRKHEGHSGWTIEQVDGLVPQPAFDEVPHIVLLHIGTNDMYQTPSGAPDRLGTLIDQIIDTAPDALLVVSTIIPFPGSSAQVATYNEAVPDVVQQRMDEGAHIVFVDQFEGFPTGELDDGVHPNEQGYARMAGVWWDAIVDYLP